MTKEEAIKFGKLIIEIAEQCDDKESEHTIEFTKLAVESLENQKTGHWIKQHIGQITTYKCSECGRTVKDDTGYDVTKDYPYCNCGAKMEGE